MLPRNDKNVHDALEKDKLEKDTKTDKNNYFAVRNVRDIANYNTCGAPRCIYSNHSKGHPNGPTDDDMEKNPALY